ncbi:MAG: GHKL domain-containing protein [Defluviitaleaceae bacterium]|nr:GHKL domain-containing protein [Defluviitaleaceae bacterium]
MIQRMSAVAGSYFVLHSITVIYEFFSYIFPVNLADHFMDLPFIVSTLLSYLIVLIVFPHLMHIKKATNELHKIGFPFLLIVFTHVLFAVVYQFNLPYTVAIYGMVGTLVTAFTIFFLYNHLSKAVENNVKSALHTQEKEYYFTQCRLMQKSVENIKSMRHDMKLHLATARDFISTDKTVEATAYLNGLLGDIEESGVYSNTKNIAFDSIINFKLNNAKQENIKLDIRLLIPPALSIEVADIVTIMGNLLDNALDAVSKVEEKKIKLDIEYSRESLFIQVENTFDGVVKCGNLRSKFLHQPISAAAVRRHGLKHDNNADDKRIATRKSGGEHGHGLKNIRKSVEKYNGHIDITHDENIFSVTVLLYVDDWKI